MLFGLRGEEVAVLNRQVEPLERLILLRIPPGRLSAGLGYVFLVRPFYVPGLDFAKTPFMSGSTSASADVLSGLMQP